MKTLKVWQFIVLLVIPFFLGVTMGVLVAPNPAPPEYNEKKMAWIDECAQQKIVQNYTNGRERILPYYEKVEHCIDAWEEIE